ncbi:MAG: hypothetical protein HYX49_11170 [Chloroflexi bacterium]|nr:hypothetical protein [Chloroflexota bacterium]
MRYRDLQIQTQRVPPSNARTEGFAWLARAGYITRENQPTKLGKESLSRLQTLFQVDENRSEKFHRLGLPVIAAETGEIFFPFPAGPDEILHCPSCHYAAQREAARFQKIPFPAEPKLPLEKILTPECSTIESLANFLNLPKEKTAKALMFTRLLDNKFIFVVVRGDMQMSEAKLTKLVGQVRPATAEEIAKAGAAAGYASSVGLKDALIVVDDLIPQSNNLVAGANQAGFHLLNTNCGRDYKAELIADLAQAKAGDVCINCGQPLSAINASLLATRSSIRFDEVLSALAEVHHDDKGLTLPKEAAPFNVYLMQLPGKELDTRAAAENLYQAMQKENITVLFDDRDERAGVKFNDADLIGCPLRVTVGEKNLRAGMVELKPRKAAENQLAAISEILFKIKNAL